VEYFRACGCAPSEFHQDSKFFVVPNSSLCECVCREEGTGLFKVQLFHVVLKTLRFGV
jgi:hypothetical protein